MTAKLRMVLVMALLILPATVGAGPSPVPAAPAPAAPAAPAVVAATPDEQLVLRYYAALNEGDLDAVAGMLAEDFQCDAALPGMTPGRAGFRAFLALLRTAFPDARFEPVQLVSAGGTTVCRFRFTGTHRAKFLNLRPTHKAAAVTGIDVWAVRDGRLAGLHGNFDALGLLVQLGLVPPVK